MRRVHWSVWGLLGFFGMLAVGLWIDAHWLPGVGVTTPVTVISTPLPITRVEREIEPAAAAPGEAGDVSGLVQADQAIAPEGWSLECPSPDTDAGAILEDLKCSDVSLRDAPELLPEPELVPAPSVEQPLDTSEFEHIQLGIPIGPTASEALPAREPSATHEAAANDEPGSSSPPPPALDDPDIRAFMELWKGRAGGSPELTPSAAEVAEAIRRRRELDRGAAPTLDLPSPPVPPRSTVEPPTSPSPPGSAPFASRTASPEQIEALRMASRQLDEIANQLEQQGLYQRADQMRQLAQELRVDARKGVQQPPTPLAPDDLPPVPDRSAAPPRT